MKTAKKLCLWAWCLMAVALLATACGDAKVTMPPGPDGDRGNDGLTAYLLWKDALKQGTVTDWDANKDTEADFAKYLQGKDGANGTNGKDGKDGESAYAMWKRMVETGQVDDPHNKGQKWPATKTTVQDFWKFLTGGTGESGQVPRISDDGYWVVGGVKTKYKARGNKGTSGNDADAPKVEIENGMWKINGVVTNHRAEATDGTNGTNGTSPTLTINDQGMWVINGNPTTTRAKAQDGSDVEITISDGGNWFINGNDSGIKAFGEKGDPGIDGQDGKSAFQLWQEYIKGGKVNNPHNPKEKWPEEKNSKADFWEFLSGYNEVEVEKNAVYIIRPREIGTTMINGKPYKEFQNQYTGEVFFRLFKNGHPVGEGYEVSMLPATVKNWDDEAADASVKFTTDKHGVFIVPAKHLPNSKELTARTGPAKVKAPGAKVLVDSKPVVVPNRINVRIKITKAFLNSGNTTYPSVGILAEIEREIEKDNWTKQFPVNEQDKDRQWAYQIKKIKDHNNPLTAANLDPDPKRRWWASQPTYYTSNRNTPAHVTRPFKLLEEEESYQPENATAKRDFENKVLSKKWNEQDNYVTVVVPNAFGRMWIAEDMVIVPEIYPGPALLESSLKIDDTNAGDLILYGEVDKNSIQPFYLTSASKETTTGGSAMYQEADVLFVKENHVWKPQSKNGADAKGKFAGTDYTKSGDVISFAIAHKKGTSREISTNTANVKTQNLKFKTNSVSVDSKISISAVVNGGKNSFLWRNRDVYMLKKDATGYYLESYYKPGTKRIDIQKQQYPSDFLTTPSNP